MSLSTLNLTKENTFLKEMSVGTPTHVSDMSDGSKQKKEWRKRFMPGAFNGKVIHWDDKKRQYPITLPQKELDEIVKSLGLTNEKYELITTADRRNKFDDFFCHNKLVLMIDSDVTKLDDDDPLIKLFNNYFENNSDSGVSFYEKTPKEFKTVSTANSRYTLVKNQTFSEAEEQKEMKSTTDAISIVMNDLSEARQASILSAMGFGNVSKASPDLIKQRLINAITDRRNDLSVNKQDTNIDLFWKLTEEDDDGVNTMGLVEEAKKAGLLVKRDKKYRFGEVSLGTTLKTVYNYLNNPENSDIVDSLRTGIKALETEKQGKIVSDVKPEIFEEEE